MANPTSQTAEALIQKEQTVLCLSSQSCEMDDSPRFLHAEERIVQGLLASNPAMATGVGVEKGRGKRNEEAAWQLGNRPKVGGSEESQGTDDCISKIYANKCIRTKLLKEVIM